MAIRINTRNYRNTHGKAPRGRGTWTFEIECDRHYGKPNQLYSEACREIRKTAKHYDADEIILVP